MKSHPFPLAVAAMLCLLAGHAQAVERHTYIVQLVGQPAATYTGELPGLARTQAANGQRFRFHVPAVRAYVSHLSARQDALAALVPEAPILARYTTVLNGFAASLSEAELQTLKASGLVASIVPDQARRLVTVTTPGFLGLSAPGGLWSQTVAGGLDRGEDVIIGMLDGGIWPENPAFADREVGGLPSHDTGGVLVYGAPPAGWHGDCVAGAGFFPARDCNNKLIGAQFFNAGFKATGLTLHWSDFADSPRDSVGGAAGHGGHGTHTASTAGGNGNNAVILNGIPMGDASGMAPRARLAMYKVCWTYVDPSASDGSGSSNACFESDSVAAIDQAVQDGVQVLNFSISGSQTSVNDPVEQAFLRAAAAGVFVAASAGNAGPDNMVAHISPWLTTVAASTHARALSADVSLGNGAKYTGASLNLSAVPPKALIRSVDAKAASAASSDAELCFLNSGGQPTLDPAKAAGKIVVCTRGTNARVEKSLTVLNAGGVGMVLVDNGAGLIAERHSVPTVHVSAADGALVLGYASGVGASATLSHFYAGVKPAPIMANFSSRGPNLGDANVLKPDLTAPGVDVIAGVTPALSQGDHDAVAAGTLVPPYSFESYNGTSMSSPHVAGLAALLRQAHPDWSPAAIKSALMSSASPTLDDGLPGVQNGRLPWSQGAGHVTPNAATDPGLVYDAGMLDWTRYQCKVNKAAVPHQDDCSSAAIGTLDETYNLNLPSITVGAVAGAVTVLRKVTNVGAGTATYNASIVAPGGFSALASPASLTLAPGETKSFTLTLYAAGALEGAWGYGSLSWSDGTHLVRIPLTARLGKAITAPDELLAASVAGSRLITLKTGVSGRIGARKGGMSDVTLSDQASLSPGALSTAAFLAACAAGSDTATVKVYHVSIPADTIVARFALRQQDVSGATDDNDLMVITPSGGALLSGGATSDEALQLAGPPAGAYTVCVTAYAGAAPMLHRLSSWIVTPTSANTGKLSVLLPGAVSAASSATAGITWSALAEGGRYVGGVQFTFGASVQASTVLRIDTNGDAPQVIVARDLSPAQLSNED